MPHTSEELLKLATQFEELSKTAKKEERKLDPKAKVRNRGTVCVPASSAKDKKDHFPINSENQARNALSRVHQYSKAPEWYSGSLKGLQDLVSRKVHSKYPSIGKEKKKSAFEVVQSFIAKYSQDSKLDQAVADYDTGALLVQHLAEAMKRSAEAFAGENSLDEANNRKTYDTLLKQAELVHNLIPEMEALDKEMWDWDSPEEATEAEEPPMAETV